MALDGATIQGELYEAKNLKEVKRELLRMSLQYSGIGLKHAMVLVYDRKYGHVREVQYLEE